MAEVDLYNITTIIGKHYFDKKHKKSSRKAQIYKKFNKKTLFVHRKCGIICVNWGNFPDKCKIEYICRFLKIWQKTCLFGVLPLYQVVYPILWIKTRTYITGMGSRIA